MNFACDHDSRKRKWIWIWWDCKVHFLSMWHTLQIVVKKMPTSTVCLLQSIYFHLGKNMGCAESHANCRRKQKWISIFRIFASQMSTRQPVCGGNDNTGAKCISPNDERKQCKRICRYKKKRTFIPENSILCLKMFEWTIAPWIQFKNTFWHTVKSNDPYPIADKPNL